MEEVHVIVKTMDDTRYTIAIPAGDVTAYTIGDLKGALVQHTSIPVDRQRLIHRGATLGDDSATLAHSRIGHLTTVHLVAR